MNWLRKVAFGERAAEVAGDMEEANASSSSDGGASRAVPHEPNSTECAVRASSGLFEHAASPSEGLDARKACGSVPVLLAPMAGVNDIAFRQLSLELGCDITYTEMVSSKALSFANEKTRHLLDRAPNERRVAVQLFGHEPETMAREAAWIESEMGDALAYIDINMGCPARKIVKKGDGSALMTTPELAAEIVRKVSAAVEHPTTVKFRKGYAADEDIAVDFARRHGRCRRCGGCGARPHGGAILFGMRRLGRDCACEGRRRGTRYRQWRCDWRERGVCARGANGLRCRDDRSRRAGEPVGVRAGARRLKRRSRACAAYA